MLYELVNAKSRGYAIGYSGAETIPITLELRHV